MWTGERGFTLIGLLFVVAGLGVAMAALGVAWHSAVQREREKELLFIGDQYRRAIGSFWKTSPVGQQRLPKNFEELILDPRFPHKVRHLRRVYADPMTRTTDWGLVKDEVNGIRGVHSLSEAKPYKVANFRKDDATFEGAASYKDWAFIFVAEQKKEEKTKTTEDAGKTQKTAAGTQGGDTTKP